MIVNFRAREISRGACKLIQTPILIQKKNYTRAYIIVDTFMNIARIKLKMLHINFFIYKKSLIL